MRTIKRDNQQQGQCTIVCQEYCDVLLNQYQTNNLNNISAIPNAMGNFSGCHII
jgi:hypothetical protein